MGAQRHTDFEVILYYLNRKKQELKRALGVIRKGPAAAFERERIEGQLDAVNDIIHNVENRMSAKDEVKAQIKRDKVGYRNDRCRQRTYSPTCA